MLVIARRQGESVVFSPTETVTLTPEDKIEVVISGLSSSRCVMGIQAPATFRIVRGELANKESNASPLKEDC
jgi:sRNA-binding carbon storage regulator CsrA